MQRRRVSAPSDPPSASQDTRPSAHGGRVKRTRHWRMKNKAAENSGSGTASGAMSSNETSTDDHTPPNAPVTSPAERVDDHHQTSVKFAPGT